MKLLEHRNRNVWTTMNIGNKFRSIELTSETVAYFEVYLTHIKVVATLL